VWDDRARRVRLRTFISKTLLNLRDHGEPVAMIGPAARLTVRSS
jgi:hypothetical protein